MLKTCNICKYCFKIKISLEILNDDILLAETFLVFIYLCLFKEKFHTLKIFQNFSFT